MKSLQTWFTLLLCAVAIPVLANKSDGLAPGDPIGTFYVVKVAGANDDGVEVGQDLCYRCRYGSSPMAMVFVRSTGGQVESLVKQLDALVLKHDDQRFRTLVTFLGEDTAKIQEDAEKLAKAVDAKHAAISIAKENQTGPLNYHIPADAEVTIILARDSQVMQFVAGSADEIDVEKIVAMVGELVKEESL
jgi:hypothetical protein